MTPVRRIIIPARYASTRLHAKLLIEIQGKPILQHTYERALSCRVDSVLIATDSLEIMKIAEKIGAPACMTREDHVSGSDRCAEAMLLQGYNDSDIIVNLQGDEPLIPTENILAVMDNMQAHPEVAVATLCERISTQADLFNPNVVKVVFNHMQHALYFSRAPIPWARDDFPTRMPNDSSSFYRHIGLYGYRGSFLRAYPHLPHSPLEKIESLEQLRVLWNAYPLHVGLAPEKNPSGVDDAASLEAVRQSLSA